jgi:hypothetical protein
VRIRSTLSISWLNVVVSPVALNWAGMVSCVKKFWTGCKLPESCNASKSNAANDSSPIRIPTSPTVRGLRSVLRIENNSVCEQS